MTNSAFCHQFFYDEDFTASAYYGNMHYDNGRFYSYNTIIGKVIKGKDRFANVLLLSKYRFSSTTAKHISYLRQACYFNIIEVPVNYSQYDLEPDKMVKDLCEELDSQLKVGFSTADLRDNYRGNLDALIALKAHGIAKIRKTIIDKYERIWAKNTDLEALKAERAKKAAATRKANEKLRKEYDSILKKYSYLDQVRLAYDYWYKPDYHKHQSNLRKLLNPKNEWSFIWKTEDGYETSKGLRLDARPIDIALKLYESGKLKRGMTIARYTVLEVMDDHVTVGCHKVPVENIKAIMEDANI